VFGEAMQKTIGIDKNEIDMKTAKILVNFIKTTASDIECTEI
jgi:hypothetical protein